MSQVAACVSERLARYGFGDGHPFGPDRLDAFVREFEARGLNRRVQLLEPRTASDEELRSFHTPALPRVRARARPRPAPGFSMRGDTPAFRGVYEAAAGRRRRHLECMEAIMRGECRRAFVPIAGLHHAARERAAGFCVFNDCGVAIEQLQARGPEAHCLRRHRCPSRRRRVLRLRRGRARWCSRTCTRTGATCIRAPARPSETGRGPAAGTKLNVPLPPGADDEVFAAGLAGGAGAPEEDSTPEFFILQCGADSIEGDPITHLRFTPRTARPRRPRAGSSPTDSATGACWRSVAGVTTASTSPGLEPRSSRTCCKL